MTKYHCFKYIYFTIYCCTGQQVIIHELLSGFFWLDWNHSRVWLICQLLKISTFCPTKKFIIVKEVVLMLLKCLKGEQPASIMSCCVCIVN